MEQITDISTPLTPEQLEAILALQPEIFVTEDEEPTEGTVAEDRVLN